MYVFSNQSSLLQESLAHTTPCPMFLKCTRLQLDLGQIRSDDNTLTPDSPLVTFREVRLPLSPSQTRTNIPKLFEEAGRRTGCTFEISELMGDMISSAGFINRVDTAIKTPIGGWAPDPKLSDLGRWALLGFDLGLEGYTMATLTRVLGVCCPATKKTLTKQQIANQLRVVDSNRSTSLTVRLSTPFFFFHTSHYFVMH